MKPNAIHRACAALLAVLLLAACSPGAVTPLSTPSAIPLLPTIVQETMVAIRAVTRTPEPPPMPTEAIAAAPTQPAADPTTAPLVSGKIQLDPGVNEVNVRAGPSTRYPILGTLPKGQVVTITGRSPHGEWWQIRSNGVEGWVYAAYVVVTDNAEEVPCIGPFADCSRLPAADGKSQPAGAGLVFEPQQAATVNGILMRLEQVEISAAATNLILCYEKPTHQGNSDWMLPRDTTLQVGARVEKLEQYGLLADPDVGLSDGRYIPPPGGRCVTMGLPLGHANQPGPLTLTLSVPYLEKSQPEVIPDPEIQKANARLKLMGIEMSYHIIQTQGGGGGGPVIVHKPEGMSDDEVLRQFFAALGYYYTGPWIFTFTITVPEGAN